MALRMFKHKFLRVFREIIRVGITEEDDAIKSSRVMNYNLELLTYMGFTLLSLVAGITLYNVSTTFFTHVGIVALLSFLGCYYLNTLGYFTYSIILSTFIISALVSLLSSVTGSEGRLHYFLLSISLSPLLFLYEKKWMGYVLVLAIYIVFILLAFDLVPNFTSVVLSKEDIFYARAQTIFLIIPLTASRMFYIFHTMERLLRDYKTQSEYLRKIVDLNPSFIFTKNREGKFTTVNQAVANAYGTTPKALIGKTDADFNENPDELEHFRKDDLEVMDGKFTKFIPLEVITNAKGEKQYLQTVKTPIINAKGEANEVLGVSTDITDRINSQKKLETITQDLAKKNEELTKYIDSNAQLENFAFVASHDLKEPIRSMIGYAQLLEKRYADKLDNEGLEFIQHIISSTKNMNRLILDLLSFSRVNTEQMRMEKLPFAKLEKDLMSNLNASIVENNAQVIWQSEPDFVFGDYTRLLQLFQNIISNGIKFHKPTESPKVIVNYKEEANMHCFTFQDNGIGIPEKYKAKVFQLFNRLHDRSVYEGSGIGLATCKKIVEQHQGIIKLESKEDEGTIFYVFLPMSDNGG